MSRRGPSPRPVAESDRSNTIETELALGMYDNGAFVDKNGAIVDVSSASSAKGVSSQEEHQTPPESQTAESNSAHVLPTEPASSEPVDSDAPPAPHSMPTVESQIEHALASSLSAETTNDSNNPFSRAERSRGRAATAVAITAVGLGHQRPRRRHRFCTSAPVNALALGGRRLPLMLVGLVAASSLALPTNSVCCIGVLCGGQRDPEPCPLSHHWDWR